VRILQNVEQGVVVCVVIRLRVGELRNHGLFPGKEHQISLYFRASKLAVGSIQPLSQWVRGCAEVKLPGCEADHSPPSSSHVKNEWSYTSTPLYSFMAITETT
jgi:hypothetical protein